MVSIKQRARFTSRNTVSGHGTIGVDIRFSMPQLYAMAEVLKKCRDLEVSSSDWRAISVAGSVQAIFGYIIGDLEMPTAEDLWPNNNEEQLTEMAP